MDDGDAHPRLLLTALIAGWIFACGTGLRALAPGVSDRPDATFLGWQGVAAMLALGAFGLGRRWRRGSGVRRLAAVPLVLTILAAAVPILVAAVTLDAVTAPYPEFRE